MEIKKTVERVVGEFYLSDKGVRDTVDLFVTQLSKPVRF